jgi:hypothetical protein
LKPFHERSIKTPALTPFNERHGVYQQGPLLHSVVGERNWWIRAASLVSDFAELEYGSFGSATDAVVSPQLKPRAASQGFIVPSISSRNVRRGERSPVRRREHAFEVLNFGNGLLDVHS